MDMKRKQMIYHLISNAKEKLVFIGILIWNFFICLSIIIFLNRVFWLVKENTKDTPVIIFSVCGFCFLIIIIVEWRFDPIFKEYKKVWGIKK